VETRTNLEASQSVKKHVVLPLDKEKLAQIIKMRDQQVVTRLRAMILFSKVVLVFLKERNIKMDQQFQMIVILVSAWMGRFVFVQRWDV